ncbi:MAG: tetratricopeptide repeat protein [Pontiellaceae bacterium]|nr:tetratricopeptide repeat protein [Pontiellaceae bacterium]
MSNKEHSEQHAALLKKNKLRQDEVEEVKAVVKKYLVPCLTAVIVVCIGFMAVGLARSLKQKKLDNACTALQEANIQMAVNPLQAIESYVALADKYDSSPYAPIALMRAAMAKYNQDDYAGAEALFSKVVDQYADHELALTAEYNEIICREERGLIEEAEKQYASFAEKNRESYLSTAARMAQARCLETLGKQKEALQIYEELTILNTPWQASAAEKQAMLSRRTAL